MDAVKISFANGNEVTFPFGPDSTLNIETPDGVNGVQRGVWGEVVGVEYVKGGDVAPVDDAPAETPAVETPAVDVTPDPSESAASGSTASLDPAQSDASSSSDGSTTLEPSSGTDDESGSAA